MLTSLLESGFIESIFEQKISSIEDEIDESILEISRNEIDDQYQELISLIDTADSSDLELKRLIHTLKGTLRMTGFNRAGAITHRIETVLDYCESHHIPLTDIKSFLSEEASKIEVLMSSEPLSEESVQWVDGENYLEQKNIIQPVIKKDSIIIHKDKFIRVKSQSIDNLVQDAGEIRLSKASLDEVARNQKKQLLDLRQSISMMQQIVKEIGINAETQIRSKRELYQPNSVHFDPLEFDQFTRLQELTRFMNESLQDITSYSDATDNLHKQQDDIINQQTLYSNNLISELNRVRMVSIESVSDKFYKIWRGTSKELSKTVLFNIEGEKTEVDKLVLDRIFDPIAHLIRNSIYHGIESEADRLLLGKPGVGRVTITVFVEGNYVVFSVEDDGKGIDTAKIRQAAIDKKIIKANESLSPQEIINLIFLPGLTTANQVSEVAGRGVGMEIVLNEIKSMGGTIKVNTRVGVGTEFVLRIPLAMTNSQAMLCMNSQQLVALPTFLIDSVISIKKQPLSECYHSGFVVHEKKKIKLYYIGHVMGGPINDTQLPELNFYNNILILQHNDERIALHVDSIINTTDILIRAANRHLERISGVLGTTVLGDGTLGLIVNPIMLLDYWKSKQRVVHWNKTADKSPDLSYKEKNLIMVIDDSVTVRKTTEKILQNYGFDVVLAKHGSDALELLQAQVPDLILCDIEMPVMDGFDFLTNLKNTSKYQKIPIFMITSRTAEKHKSLAMKLGANEFFGKPFQEKQLVSMVKQYLAPKN